MLQNQFVVYFQYISDSVVYLPTTTLRNIKIKGLLGSLALENFELSFKFYTDIEMQKLKDLAKKNKTLHNQAEWFLKKTTKKKSFKFEKDRHVSTQKNYLKKFDDKIRYQFTKKGS